MIIPLFAEIPAALEITGVVLGLLFSGTACVVALIALFKKQDTQITPQPLDVNVIKSLHEQFASKEQFDKLAAKNDTEHKDIHSKIGGVERGANSRLDLRLAEMQKSAEEGREKLHKRINTISVGVARLCGRAGLPLPKEDDEL